MSFELGLFWLLLPTAAGVSWYLARRNISRSSGQHVDQLRSTYFRGLNYLLNEQPDKAIEVFLEIAQIDNETVETHLALGSLFRRRGEVDRAIRVHQNLIARQSLSAEQRFSALMELGEDYMRAGLLDRAETLFNDLLSHQEFAASALKHLISIYQQERDWRKAIDHALRYQQITGESQGELIAQYYCELIDSAYNKSDGEAARAHLEEVFRHHSGSVRGRMIEAKGALDAGDSQAAMRAYRQVIEADIDYASEVLAPVKRCFEVGQDSAGYRKFLKELADRYQGIAPIIEMTHLIEADQGSQSAIHYLAENLRERPSVRGVMKLIELAMRTSDEGAKQHLSILSELLRRVLDGRPIYRCQRCGFGARAHHWQCPSCKSWDTVKPIHGISRDGLM